MPLRRRCSSTALAVGAGENTITGYFQEHGTANAGENTITEYFQQHGSIRAVRPPTDRETGAQKGFECVEMVH